MSKLLRKITKKFHHLFVPHRGNNHRSKLLHHDSLQKIIILLLLTQIGLSLTLKLKPGILGFASNISVSDVISLTNQKRAENGLDPLAFNPVLSNSAVAKANHMFSHNYWAHNAPDGTTPWYFFQSAGYSYLYAGENLARDFGSSGSVVDAWMNSATHRENILSGRYSEIGIGVVNGILDGQETTLVVQHFARPSTPQVSLDTPDTSQAIEPEPIPEIAVSEPDLAPQIIPEQTQVEQIEVQPEPDQSETLTQSVQPEFVSVTKSLPASTFGLTKTINIVIIIFLVCALFIDGFIIYRCKIERRTGKNLIHITFFIVIAIILVLSSSGKIV